MLNINKSALRKQFYFGVCTIRTGSFVHFCVVNIRSLLLALASELLINAVLNREATGYCKNGRTAWIVLIEFPTLLSSFHILRRTLVPYEIRKLFGQRNLHVTRL